MRSRNMNGVNQAGYGFSLQGPILVGEPGSLSAIQTVLGTGHGLILLLHCPLSSSCNGSLATVSFSPYSALERHLKNT